MSRENALETTAQRLFYDDAVTEQMLHLPLMDLGTAAPSTEAHIYQADKVDFPFSNDKYTGGYFEQLTARTETPEYSNTPNRVALLVGESGLAANLKHIPEETVVLFDISPDMCIFMNHYIDSLRVAVDPQEWFNTLNAFGPSKIQRLMGLQVDNWQDNGQRHPLIDEVAFYEAQNIARQKSIVPWCGDITDRKAVAVLGTALNKRNAVVTMMNLTNVLPYASEFRHPNECAALLDELPVTPNAPILTTGLGRRNESLVEALSFKGNPVTGPFFGLHNLSRAGVTEGGHELGAIAERNGPQKHLPEFGEPEFVDALLQKLMSEALGFNVGTQIMIGVDVSGGSLPFERPNDVVKPAAKRFWRRHKR